MLPSATEVILVVVKEQCRIVANQLIFELDNYFPDHELMNTLEVVFP